MKVVKIKTANDKLIDDSEIVLQDAIDRKLSEIVIIGKGTDGMLYLRNASNVDRLKIIGAMEEIKFALIQKSYEI